MNAAIRRTIDQAPDGSLAAVFRSLPNRVHEMRVALSAGYDTTAHTMAWLLAHTAQRSELVQPAHRDAVINEVLRLYPAGWVGSRRCARELTFGDVRIPKGVAIAVCGLVDLPLLLAHRDLGEVGRIRILLTSGWFLLLGYCLSERRTIQRTGAITVEETTL